MSAEHFEGLIKDTLKASINSAIGIDDEFVEPYDDTATDSEKRKTSSELYNVFHRELNCTLSLFRYRDFSDFSERALPLLNNKDLLLLDWQLKGEGMDAINDVVKIIDRAVSQESPIRFIVIYTAFTDLYSLARNLFAAFMARPNGAPDIDSIKGAVDDILTSNQEELTIDNLEKEVRSNLSRCLLDKNRKEAKTAINKKICKQLSKATKDALKDYADSFDDILVQLELSLCPESVWSLRDVVRDVRVMEEDVLLIDNTAVFLVTKQGFGPNELVSHLRSKMTSLNNWRSLLFSLKFKDLVSDELLKVGKGLGGFSDSVLMRYFNQEGSDSILENITNCFNAQVGDVLSKFDNLDELWAEGSCKVPSAEESARLVCFLSFNPHKNGETHRINTGDVFMLKGEYSFLQKPEDEKKPEGEKIEEKYLMCISQSCDCLKPEKVYNNLSFAIGEKVSSTSALSNMQKECYTIVNGNDGIKWGKRFLTIHIPKEKQTFSSQIDCPMINRNEEGEMVSQSIEMLYLGRQKEIYAQRVINAVFSHAMRIGIGLPTG
jgi:hypothetical protein